MKRVVYVSALTIATLVMVPLMLITQPLVWVVDLVSWLSEVVVDDLEMLRDWADC